MLIINYFKDNLAKQLLFAYRIETCTTTQNRSTMRILLTGVILIIANLVFSQTNDTAHQSQAGALQVAEEHYKNGDWPEAAASLRQTLAESPRMQAAWYHLALVYFQMNDYLETELHLEKLFAINPMFEKAYSLYGLALYHRGAYPQAILAFNFAIENHPTDELRLARAICYIAEGEPKFALPDLDEILYKDPGHPQACLSKAAALMELGKHAYALRFLNRIIENDPENTNALTNRAICHFYLGEGQKSDADFQAALSVNANTHTLLARAKCSLKANKPTAALSDVKAAMRLDPKAPEVYFVLGELEMEMGKYGAAIESFDIALDLDHTCIDCYLLKSEAKTQTAQYQEAVNDLHAAMDLAPGNQRAKELLLWVYAKMDGSR